MEWTNLPKFVKEKDFWVSWPGLLVIEVLYFVGFFAVDQALVSHIIDHPIFRFATFGLVPAIILWLCWQHFHESLPEPTAAEPSKVLRIAVAVETRDAEAKTLLDIQFVSEFRNQIADNQLQDLIEVIPSENHQAVKIGKVIAVLEKHRNLPQRSTIIASTKESWTKIHQTVKAEFYVWGNLEKVLGKFVLDFKGYVDENTAPEMQGQLAAEYKVFGIQKRILDESVALNGVAVEAKFFYIVAQYIVSLVALYTGRFEISFRIHKSLEKNLEDAEEFPAKQQIVESLRKRLSTLHFLNSRLLMSNVGIAEAETELEVAKDYDPTNGSVYMFAGANAFILRRDLQSAWTNTQLAKKYAPDGDRSWEYSEAFLLLAKGTYRPALDLYEKILSNEFPFESQIVEEVIDFNKTVLAQNALYIPSQFIIPLMQGKKQGKLNEGIEGLDRFIKKIGKARRYQLLREAAKKYRDELKVQDGLEQKVDGMLSLH